MISVLALCSFLHAYNPALSAPFFRSPASLFSSGEANIIELRKSFVSAQPDQRLFVNINGSPRWIPDFGFATDVTVSRHVFIQGSNKKWIIESSLGATLKAKSPQGLQVFSISEASTDPSDPGIAYTIVNAGIRQAQDWKSEVLTVVPSGSRLEIIDFKEEWILVKFGEVQGFIDYGRVLLKADFASFVLSASNNWLPVSHRQSGQWILKDQTTLKISRNSRFITRPDLAIAIEARPDLNSKVRSHFLINRQASSYWNVSHFNKHEKVYWKEPAKPSVDVLSTEQILKMEINSVAFHPFDTKQALISANGIYYTYDAVTWKKINKFSNQNHPVYISSTGDWIVGNFKAEKNTLDFKPYFKIESLTSQIQNTQKASVKFLKIEKIESADQNTLKISVDTGNRKLSVTGHWLQDSIHSWSLQ